mmetsp:Transcript_33496/g.77841  ORF Transcript_33496/g.77841 Transcript_33496/m.77841 type:complete len:448 (-) Transcript_33496:91-1434(-)
MLKCAGLALLVGLCLVCVNDHIGSRAAAVLVGLLLIALALPPPRPCSVDVGRLDSRRVVPARGAATAPRRKPTEALRSKFCHSREEAIGPQAQWISDRIAVLEQLHQATRESEVLRQQEERAQRQLTQLQQAREWELDALQKREQQASELSKAAQARADEQALQASKLSLQLEALREERNGLRRQLEEALEHEHVAAERVQEEKAKAEEASLRARDQARQLQDLAVEVEEARASALEARQQEQQAVRMHRQARVEAEQASVQASMLLVQLDALREGWREGSPQHRSEGPRRGDAVKWEKKLVSQLRELQEEHDELLQDRDRHRKDLEQRLDELGQQRRAVQKLQEALQRERQRSQQLESQIRASGRAPHERLRRQGSMPSLASGFAEDLAEAAAIDALGGILQRSIRSVPADKRQNFKRQLLLCFHPDRNPATEVATRVTQILNGEV